MKYNEEYIEALISIIELNKDKYWLSAFTDLRIDKDLPGGGAGSLNDWSPQYETVEEKAWYGVLYRLLKATWAANRKLTTTGATATGIGEGRLNTNQIVAAQGIFATYAAIECDNSTRNGKSDWFLPSKDELNELFKQKEVVGNFAVTGYWSSSEIDSAYAWHQGFSIGLQGAGGPERSPM